MSEMGCTKGTGREKRGREKGASLISTVREEKEPEGHARKRLEQVALGLSKCYSVMSPLPSPVRAGSSVHASGPLHG